MGSRFDSVVRYLIYAKRSSELLEIALLVQNVIRFRSKGADRYTCFFIDVLSAEAYFVMIVVEVNNLLTAYDGLPAHYAFSCKSRILTSLNRDLRNLGLCASVLHIWSLCYIDAREGEANALEHIILAFEEEGPVPFFNGPTLHHFDMIFNIKCYRYDHIPSLAR
ncbi:MAG: hypothetical protein A4S16_06820 [Proteobacteria bacterium SG_bin6]|nr:MAG: hypothetical protein A4S16_06820 [Proteobacteria bacterium SG_bin6]